MPRPRKNRCVTHTPAATYFKPRAVPLAELREVVLGMDELEAFRLCDHLGLSQQDAAVRMEVSQSTLQRLLERARSRVAQALAEGHAIAITE